VTDSLSSSGFRLGASLVVLATFALSIIAWRGLQNHREIVWNEARDLAEDAANRFENEVTRDLREIRFYQYPPTPGDAIFDSKASLEVLREQANSDDRTTSGLPVAVLAAFEIAKRTGKVRDGELARDLARGRWPDLTSPLILERLSNLATKHQWPGEFSAWKNDWDSDEKARDLIRDRKQDGWFSNKGTLHFYVNVGENRFQYLSLDKDSHPWIESRSLGVQFGVDEHFLGDSGKPLVRRSLQNADLSVGVLDPSALEEEWRIRRRDTILMLGFSTLVIGAGMWIMTRGILKEKKVAHAKNQFVASVTHELRAPVGSMRLMADSLKAGKLSNEKTSEFHRLMSRESGRLSVLIENVMDLARVEDGQRVLRKDTLQFNEVIAESREILAMQAEEKNITFKSLGKALEVKADPVALRQILVNLIDNALKFSPEGGTITLSWGEGWWFAIADEGPGIEKKDRQHIFERFYRGEDELTRQTKGVGIGLSLVKELVELHGGVVSVNEGKGAKFTVKFSKS